MLTVLLIEDDAGDIEKSLIQLLRPSRNTRLDVTVLWLTQTEIDDEQRKESIRKKWNVSHLYCISREDLTYESLRDKSIELVEELEPDIVITDLRLQIPGVNLELCNLKKNMVGKYTLEGVQLTRDLEKTGLVSYFVWISNNAKDALSVNTGYMCELMDGSIPLVNIPRVVAIEKGPNWDMLSKSIDSIGVDYSKKLHATQALNKIPQGNLIKLYTDFTDEYNFKHAIQLTLLEGGSDTQNTFRLLKRALRQLSQAMLAPHTTPCCRLGSLLSAYNKPWLDEVIKMVIDEGENVFTKPGDSLELNDRVKASLEELSDQLKNWLFCIPLSEVPSLLRAISEKLSKSLEMVGDEAVASAAGNLEFGARSSLLEIFLNVLKNAFEHGSVVSCEMSFVDRYLIVDVKTTLSADSQKYLVGAADVFINSRRGLKTIRRCLDGLNLGSRAMADGADLWSSYAGYKVNGRLKSELYPTRFESTINAFIGAEALPEVPEGCWWTRIYCPRAEA